MNKKLYVGNLPYSANDDSLRDYFSQAGLVESAKVITDRATGRSKGFGFVEMSTEEEANNSVSQFDGKEFEGRPIKVAIAKPQERNGDGPRRGGFDSNRRRSGGGGRGFRNDGY